jgi:hypothetical protein
MEQVDLPEIMLFMHTEILSGYIFISSPEGRFLEELNGRIASGPENREKFFELIDVDIQHMDGGQEKIARIHINRENIQMAAMSSTNTRRGAGGKPDPKPYPFTEKVPFPVKVMMPGYSITGNMYKIDYQKIDHVLIERTTFVPMTDAQVIALTSGRQWDVPFLAVNKDHILSLYEQIT